MKKENFYEKVANSIRERLGEEYNVVLQDIVKNNHVIIKGLIITNPANNIFPTIYLDNFWEAYCAGMRYESILDRIESIYRRDTPDDSLNFDFFRDFENVKDRICYKLVNAAENEDFLKEVPHKPFLDLAICFYYVYSNEEIGEGTILIRDVHASMWNVSVDTLMECAEKNTSKLYPIESVPMKDVLLGTEKSESVENTKFNDEITQICEEMPMQVISNKKRSQGAACILYSGMLEEIAEKYGNDFYIMPSSVHEVIVLPADKAENPEDLKEMVKTINETQLEPEEVLSDNVYLYVRADKQIKII